MNIAYLDENVWILYGMSFDPREDSVYEPIGGVFNETSFIEEINSYKKKYIVAFTADKFQQLTRDGLEKAGFEKILTFKSSHLASDEYLTLWLKSDKNAFNDKVTVGHFPYNCSVTNNRDFFHSKCIITIKKNSEELSKEFEQVKDTPIWIRVLKQFVKERY